MQISQKSKEIIDSCRFCWMCRHICPIGNATGQERNTARARALSLSLVVRGTDYSEDLVDNVYECALCGACTADCATGWDPVVFTKEARLGAALDGKLPAGVEKLLDNLETSGNIYGAALGDALAAEMKALPENADILLYLGSDARYHNPQCGIDAITLLKKAGVRFTVLADEPDSGADYDFLVGAAEETRRTMLHAAEKLQYKTIVAYDPADAKAFLREYKEWNIPLRAKVVTFTAFLAALLEDGSLKLQRGGESYTLQDSALLARDLEETEPARQILETCGTLREMLLNRKDCVIAGNRVMNQYKAGVMKLVAQRRWMNAEAAGAAVLVTAAPCEYEMLARTRPEGIELYTLEQVVLKHLA